jgi:hypothetical protein
LVRLAAKSAHETALLANWIGQANRENVSSLEASGGTEFAHFNSGYQDMAASFLGDSAALRRFVAALGAHLGLGWSCS